MTNRVEALFLCRALVLMRLIWARGDTRSLCSKHYCQRRLLHSLALFCRWRHCDIGITGAWFCASQMAPYSLQNANYGNKGSTVDRECGASLRRAHGVYLACCIVVDRWCVRCPVLKPLMFCCPPTAPLFPFSSLNAPVGEQRFALVELRPVLVL